MAKYHITAKGEPGICRATKRCPLGDESEHYPSRAEAQKAFEEANASQLTPTLRPPPLIDTDFVNEQYRNFNRGRKVNIGEFAEANSGLAPLLKGELSFTDEEGVTHSVEAIDFGTVQISKEGVVTLEGKKFKVDKEKLSGYADDLNAELQAKSDSIHEATALVWSSVGLDDFPKAPPSQKADFYVIDAEGTRHGVSVKSFIGSPPTIANSSGANSVTSSIPTTMTPKEAKNFADTVNSESSASARIKMLKGANLDFTASKNRLPETFSLNINTIASQEKVSAKKLKDHYSSAVTRFYLGDKTLTDNEKTSLRTISNHYALGMNAGSEYRPENNDVELFLVQSSDGSSALHTAKDNGMMLVLDEASSAYRKNQLAKVECEEREGRVFLNVNLSAGFRTIPNESKRATF